MLRRRKFLMPRRPNYFNKSKWRAPPSWHVSPEGWHLSNPLAYRDPKRSEENDGKGVVHI